MINIKSWQISHLFSVSALYNKQTKMHLKAYFLLVALFMAMMLFSSGDAEAAAPGALEQMDELVEQARRLCPQCKSPPAGTTVNECVKKCFQDRKAAGQM